MKQVIKRICDAIGDELFANSVANEMGAMIDAGEWSQTGPSFTRLIKTWHLTRDKVLQFLEVAEQYAKEFDRRSPSVEGFKPRYPDDFPTNPWRERMEAMHCLFIAGHLQPRAITKKTKA